MLLTLLLRANPGEGLRGEKAFVGALAFGSGCLLNLSLHYYRAGTVRDASRRLRFHPLAILSFALALVGAYAREREL